MDDRKLAWAAARLLRGGVAPRHVRRCVEELRSHRADLVAQLCAQGHDAGAAAAEAEARLGDPGDFVAAALARPELRGWASRAPWGVFVVLPLIAFILGGVGLIALVITSLEWIAPAAKASADPTAWRVGGAALVATLLWAMPLGLCGALLAIAWRSRTPPAWPAAGMLLVAAIAVVVNLQLVGPLQAGGRGELTVGVGYPPRDLLRAALLACAALGGIVMIYLRERLVGETGWLRRQATPQSDCDDQAGNAR